MTKQTSAFFPSRSPATLGAAIALGTCAVVCLLPVVFAFLGVGAATAVICNVGEAVPFVVVGGVGAAASVVLFRRRREAESGCGCAAPGTVGATESRVPIACDLSVFTSAERAEHLERSRRVFSSVEGFSEQVDGFTFTFAAPPPFEEEVSGWVEKEQRCCPFFQFDVGEPRRVAW